MKSLHSCPNLSDVDLRSGVKNENLLENSTSIKSLNTKKDGQKEIVKSSSYRNVEVENSSSKMDSGTVLGIFDITIIIETPETRKLKASNANTTQPPAEFV